MIIGISVALVLFSLANLFMLTAMSCELFRIRAEHIGIEHQLFELLTKINDVIHSQSQSETDIVDNITKALL